MPGEPDIDYNEHEPVVINTQPKYKNAAHERAMKAPIKENLDDELRKKGLI